MHITDFFKNVNSSGKKVNKDASWREYLVYSLSYILVIFYRSKSWYTLTLQFVMHCSVSHIKEKLLLSRHEENVHKCFCCEKRIKQFLGQTEKVVGEK